MDSILGQAILLETIEKDFDGMVSGLVPYPSIFLSSKIALHGSMLNITMYLRIITIDL